MKPKSIAIVGAAETTELGRIPGLSQIGLHADAALNAMRDAGLGPKDIDGVATAGETPVTIAHYLGILHRIERGVRVEPDLRQIRDAAEFCGLGGADNGDRFRFHRLNLSRAGKGGG